MTYVNRHGCGNSRRGGATSRLLARPLPSCEAKRLCCRGYSQVSKVWRALLCCVLASCRWIITRLETHSTQIHSTRTHWMPQMDSKPLSVLPKQHASGVIPRFRRWSWQSETAPISYLGCVTFPPVLVNYQHRPPCFLAVEECAHGRLSKWMVAFATSDMTDAASMRLLRRFAPSSVFAGCPSVADAPSDLHVFWRRV